jgi:hypothetical protein
MNTPNKFPVRRFTLASWLSVYGKNCYMDFVKESDYSILEKENAKLREHIVNLLPYAHMISKGETPISAYADILPHVIADSEAAVKP